MPTLRFQSGFYRARSVTRSLGRLLSEAEARDVLLDPFNNHRETGVTIRTLGALRQVSVCNHKADPDSLIAYYGTLQDFGPAGHPNNWEQFVDLDSVSADHSGAALYAYLFGGADEPSV